MPKGIIMPTIKITRNFQVTLPAKLRRLLGLEEGDIMEAEIQKEAIVLKPKKLIDKNQAWFWTKKWQKKEKEADKALIKGEYKKFDNVEDFIKDLHS